MLPTVRYLLCLGSQPNDSYNLFDTMIYPPYAVQALRWEQLSSLSSKPDIQSGDLSPSLREAQDKLRQALHDQSWLLEENQHLDVPPTHLDNHQGRIFSMGDFVRRADEARVLDIQRCAIDERGERRLLTPQQFQHLKQTGELHVPSELFENQFHTWKVAPGFYSGRQSVSRALGEGFGGALDHYVVYTSDAIVKDDKHSFHPTLRKAFVHGFVRASRKVKEAVGQLFVGRLQHRTYSDYDIDEILEDAQRNYIYYHLREHDTRCLFDESEEVDREILDKEFPEFVETYGFQTTLQEDAEDEARAKLDKVKETFEVKMIVKRKAQLNVNKSTAFGAPQAALKDFERAEEEWQDTKKQAWIDHLNNLTSDELQALGRLEADRLLALQIEEDVKQKDREQVAEELQNYEAVLKKKHPILSLSKAWRKRKIESKRLKIKATLRATRLERVAQRLEEEGLEVQSASRKLAADFCKELRDPMAQKLRDKKSAFPPAKFKVLQLDPNNWTFHGGNAINRYNSVEVDMGKRSWRLRYLWMMAVTLTKGMIGGSFHFLVSGPLSLRALFSLRPYYAMTRPVHDETSLTQTLVSRLQSFHAALRAVRQSFDDAPDTGLIGKSIQRFFLRTYLAVKGTVGTLCILTFMTVGTALATTLNLSVLVLAPVLAATMTTATALFNLIIYDTASAAARRRASCSEYDMPSCVSPVLKICIGVPYFVIFPGAFQSAMAAVRLIVHPVIGTVVLSWAALRFIARSLRDSFTWFFIRKYSRIPASDTFLAWRIHGPGLAQVEYYRLPLEAAKAGTLLLLDKYRLHAHAQVRRRELDAPYDCYSELFRKLAQPFGVNTFLQVPSPSSLASSTVWRIESRKSRARISHDTLAVPRRAEHPLDIWDSVAAGIRNPHPEFEVERNRHMMNRWVGSDGGVHEYDESDDDEEGEGLYEYAEPNDIEEEEYVEYDNAGKEKNTVAAANDTATITDVGIIEAVDYEFMKEESLRETELGEVVLRTGKLLAEWNLKMSQRDRRLTWALSIPPLARGRFRMSEVELQEVWRFTLEAVELYGQQIKEETEEVLETSEFSAAIRDAAICAADSFYSHSGARSGEDIPVVAAFLLKELLGGFDMLDTLEATDERLVLSPKMSKEDEHLIFWRAVSSTAENDQPWVLMPWS